MAIHTLFELSAMFLGILCSWSFRQRYKLSGPAGIQERWHGVYLLVLLLGMALGAWVFGTWNLVLAGKPGLGKSFVGGLAGAILSAEVFKRLIGVRQSTGLYFVPGLCVLIIVGRLGCFFAGVDDYTFGVHTDFFLAYDFGDGPRHPVQLYEAACFVSFGVVFLLNFPARQQWWLAKGFYVFLLFYTVQRFLLEFLKPYPPIVMGLNVFQVLACVLALFAIWGIYRE